MTEEQRTPPRNLSETGFPPIEDLLHEMNTPVQYLAVNLGFLKHGCQRLARALDAHHAAMNAYPGEVAERLGRVEGELDLEFLNEEIPKVLDESLEGLATVARILAAMQLVNVGREAPDAS